MQRSCGPLTCRSFGFGGRAGGLASIGGRRFCWRSVTGARTFGVKALGGSPASRFFPGAFASMTPASDARSLTSALGRWSPSGCFSAGGTRLVRRRGRRSVTCVIESTVIVCIVQVAGADDKIDAARRSIGTREGKTL